MKNVIFISLAFFGIVLVSSCRKDTTITHKPNAYILDIPSNFPDMKIPESNPLTQEGVKLGRMLFYEKRLSGDNTMSCATCHEPTKAFTDSKQFSKGITGAIGTRNSMALINLGWNEKFFWDGRASLLEEQALEPVPNPIEMHQKWSDALKKISRDDEYAELFLKAFGNHGIDSIRATKAMAQFMRTLISGNSKFDRIQRREPGYKFTIVESEGFDIFNTERGDCFHCHGSILFTKNTFNNNALDESFTDNGLGDISGNEYDNGKFKAPTLRNIELTAPYMHDGRFNTLQEVIRHYSIGLQQSPTVDPLMKKIEDGGIRLTVDEQNALIAFLKTLTDTEFITNPEFQDPH